jgi:hypothetical protein
MKRPALSALLVLTVMVVSISVAYAAPMEEIKLTTIIPDQHTLRVRKGIVSTGRYRQADFPDSSIKSQSLIIDEGNVGIGTINPVGRLDVQGPGTVILNNTGNVGIGTTAPGQKLTVVGVIETTTGGVKFPDGKIQTTAGNRCQTLQVVGKTDISNKTSDWQNMANMSITITTKGGNVLLMCTLPIYSSGRLSLRFVEGSKILWAANDMNQHDDTTVMYDPSFLVTNVSAGAHTYKIQWRDTAGSLYQYGTDSPRVFNAIEF